MSKRKRPFRVINGKKYRFYEGYATKSQAREVASFERLAGATARVIKWKRGPKYLYLVFVGPNRKRRK